MLNWLRTHLDRRPWWMNVLMFICALLAGIYVPWDFLFKPVAQDAEVWFGIVLHGWAAKATELLHWAIYAAGAYGFWRMRSWMWPWAAVYAAQLAIATLVWNVAYVGGTRGWVSGVVTSLVCAVVAVALWRARATFGPQRLNLQARYGEWALVTGASSGIGAEFARALAREGMNCVLAARREDRLQRVATDLEETFGVRTRVVPVDLTSPDGAFNLVCAVEDVEIGVLVNNAGFGYAGRFDKQDTDRLRAMVQLNCTVPVVLSSWFVPRMRARGRGALIVVGSIAGAQPVPLNAVYGATKAFNRSFGDALWAEFHGCGVDVLVVEPGPTETEFQVVAGESPHAGASAASVVGVALDALGRQPSVVPGWFNWVQTSATRMAPTSIVAMMAKRVMGQWVPEEMR